MDDYDAALGYWKEKKEKHNPDFFIARAKSVDTPTEKMYALVNAYDLISKPGYNSHLDVDSIRDEIIQIIRTQKIDISKISRSAGDKLVDFLARNEMFDASLNILFKVLVNNKESYSKGLKTIINFIKNSKSGLQLLLEKLVEFVKEDTSESIGNVLDIELFHYLQDLIVKKQQVKFNKRKKRYFIQNKDSRKFVEMLTILIARSQLKPVDFNTTIEEGVRESYSNVISAFVTDYEFEKFDKDKITVYNIAMIEAVSALERVNNQYSDVLPVLEQFIKKQNGDFENNYLKNRWLKVKSKQVTLDLSSPYADDSNQIMLEQTVKNWGRSITYDKIKKDKIIYPEFPDMSYMANYDILWSSK